jgi:uncharacterized membrane protein
MAFCSNCGTETQGRFCAKCGSPVGAGASPAASAPPPPPSPQPSSSQQSYTPPQPQAAPPPPPQGGYQQPGYQQPGYQQQSYQQQPGYAPQPAGAQSSGLTENMACALCYVLGLLTGILFLVLAPYNQNRLIRFHAFQSIFVNLGIWVAFFALFMVTSFMHLIPFVGVLIDFALYFIVGIGSFVLWLLLMYKAYNGERWVLPVVGPLAEKQA